MSLADIYGRNRTYILIGAAYGMLSKLIVMNGSPFRDFVEPLLIPLLPGLLTYGFFDSILNPCKGELWSDFLKIVLNGALWGCAVYAISRRKSTTIVVIIIMLFIMMIGWGYVGTINKCGEGGATTWTGFAKFRVQITEVNMKADGTFTGVFANAFAGSKIEVNSNNIEITDLVHPFNCTNITFDPPGKSSIIVPNGDTFSIKAKCQPSTHGDVYNIRITIPYYVAKSNDTTIGTIRGPIE